MKKYGILSIILLISYGSYGMKQQSSLAQLVFQSHLFEEKKDNLEHLKKDLESDNPEITIKTTFCKSIFKHENEKNPLPVSQQLLFNALVQHLTANPIPATELTWATSLTSNIKCSVTPLFDGHCYVFQTTCKKDEIRHLMPIS